MEYSLEYLLDQLSAQGMLDLADKITAQRAELKKRAEAKKERERAGKDFNAVMPEIMSLLNQLPDDYPEVRIRHDGGLTINIGYQACICACADAVDALAAVRRYLKAREEHPTLPVGVVDGIYD